MSDFKIASKLNALKEGVVKDLTRRKARGGLGAWLLNHPLPKKKRRNNRRRRKSRKASWTMDGARLLAPLKTNANEMIPARPYRLAQPALKPSFTVKSMGNYCVASGHDYLDTIEMTVANDKTGTILYNVPINPSFMKATRLAMQSQLWENYKFIDFVIGFKPTYPIQAGSIIGYFDADVDDNPGAVGSITNLQMVMAHDSAAEIPVCESKEWRLPKLGWANELFCDYEKEEPRLTCSGRFVLCVAVPLGIAATTSIGQLYTSYKIQYTKAQLDNNVPYGMAKVSGNVGIDATHWLGTSPVFANWNSFIWKSRPTGANNDFFLFKGAYKLTLIQAGTGLLNSTLTAVDESLVAATVVLHQNIYQGDQKVHISVDQIYSDNDLHCYYSITQTTTTGVDFYIEKLGDTAVTLEKRLERKADILIKQLKDVKQGTYEQVPLTLRSNDDNNSAIVIDEYTQKEPEERKAPPPRLRK